MKRLQRSTHRITNRNFSGRKLGNICITVVEMCLLETFALCDKTRFVNYFIYLLVSLQQAMCWKLLWVVSGRFELLQL